MMALRFLSVMLCVIAMMCFSYVWAYPSNSMDKFTLRVQPVTTPPGLGIRSICINNVVYYVAPQGGGMAVALTTKGQIITCSDYES